jgi:hypothetical protein
MPNESLESQIDRLAKFIMQEFPGESSQNEGAIDTVIKIMRKYKERLNVLYGGFSDIEQEIKNQGKLIEDLSELVNKNEVQVTVKSKRSTK